MNNHYHHWEKESLYNKYPLNYQKGAAYEHSIIYHIPVYELLHTAHNEVRIYK